MGVKEFATLDTMIPIKKKMTQNVSTGIRPKM
jgi:hypothetical protein